MRKAVLCLSFLLTSTAFADPPGVAERQTDPEIRKLIEKAIAARDLAVKSVPRARGTGTYKVTNTKADGNIEYKERARFGMAFDGSKEYIQFHYEPGAGFEDPDVYARTMFTEGGDIFEARFCQRISMGAEVDITENLGFGLVPTVWVPGKLAGYFAEIDGVLDKNDLKLSLREEKGLKILTGGDPNNRFAYEFWIDPKQNHHIVRFRVMNDTGKTPFASTDVIRDWSQTGKLWYVKRCVRRDKYHKDGEVYGTEETELTFDSFEPLKQIPREVFSIHALGLPKWAWICAKDPKDPDEENVRYEPDPKFDRAKVEKIVGKLPKVLPLK